MKLFVVFALLVALCAAEIRSVQEVEAEGNFLPALSRRQSVNSVPVDPQAANPLADLMRQHNEQVTDWNMPVAPQVPVQAPVASHAEMAAARAETAQDDMVAVAIESDQKSLVDEAARQAPAAAPEATGANAGPALTVEQASVREEPADDGAQVAHAVEMAMDPEDFAAAEESETPADAMSAAPSGAAAPAAAEAAPAVEVVNAEGSEVEQEDAPAAEEAPSDAAEEAEDAAVGEAPAAEEADPVREAAQEVERVPVQAYDADAAPSRLHRPSHHADAAAPEEAEEQRFQRHKFLITTLDKKQEVSARHGHQQDRDVEDDAGIEAHQDERMHVNPPDHSHHWENRHMGEHVHAEHVEQPGDHHHAHPLEGHHDAAPHKHHKHHHGKHNKHHVVQKVQAPVAAPSKAAKPAEHADHAEYALARKVGNPASPAMVAAAALGLGEKHFGHEESQEARKGFLADMQDELTAYAEAHEEPPAAEGVGDGPLVDQAALDAASAEAEAEQAARREEDKEAVEAQHAGFADSEIDRLMDATNDADLGPFDAARERTDGNVYRRTRPLGNFRVANKRAKAPEPKHRAAIDCDLPGSSMFASFLQLGPEGKTLQEKPRCVACVQILGYFAQKKSMNYCNCLRKMPTVDAERKDACGAVEKKLSGEMQQWQDLRTNGCVDNGTTYDSCPEDVTCGILGYC